MADGVKTAITAFGFDFGPMKVERYFEQDGRVCLGIKAGGNEITVYASRTGRSLRAFRKGGGEMFSAPKSHEPRANNPETSERLSPVETDQSKEGDSA